MIFAKSNHIPVFVLQRLELLLTLLCARQKEFETFARQVVNRSSREAILALAQECNQYAHELLGKFETMSGQVLLSADYSSCAEDSTLLTADADILYSCQVSEQKIIAAYRRLLNEPILDGDLRSFLRNQLQGLTCGFMKIKLLGSVTLR